MTIVKVYEYIEHVEMLKRKDDRNPNEKMADERRRTQTVISWRLFA